MALAYLVAFVLVTLQDRQGGPAQVAYTEFTAQVADRNVAEVFARGDTIQGELERAQPLPDREGETYRRFTTERPTFAQDDLLAALRESGAVVRATPVISDRGVLANLLISLGPILLLVGSTPPGKARSRSRSAT